MHSVKRKTRIRNEGNAHRDWKRRDATGCQPDSNEDDAHHANEGRR
ncbi:hypothetical protein RSSM_01011 [Rhodopirellula sallentina SM41]|uniref:Uncharacterized protein n=1 Tax=Rhodopirellula sallentina SM41 TaxID=1263870 RepID=M5U7X5_9BACT|nr:hypothetical protein RSSM_01011 [Rhodopirellula sallentina SM41]